MTTSQTNATRVETKIADMFATRAAAMRNGDADALVADYVPGAVRYNLDPPLQHIGADADWLRGWFAKFDGAVDFEVRDLKVTANEGIAFCHSLNRMTATPLGAPESFTMWFRATYALQHTGGKWRIVHEHESTPFYMDGSFLAATDLLPD